MLLGARVMMRVVFGGPVPDSPEFDTDRIVRDDELERARHEARQGVWQSARKVVADAGDDWEVRGDRIGVLAEAAAKDDRWLYARLHQDPSDPVALQIQAAMLNDRAADARGGATAANTSAEQFRDFEQLSVSAARVGRRAMELAEPGDPVPWVQMLSSMYASGRGHVSTMDALFEEGRRRDPYVAAPPGSAAVLLPLAAHFEFALREFVWSVRGRRKDWRRRLVNRYFRRAEVRDELDHWIAKWHAGTPGPARLEPCRQWMAAYYSLAGLRPEAKEQFDALGVHVRPALVWSWFWGERQWGYMRNWWWANGV